MTVHPLVAYWVANSSPIPEFAPVIITVAAIAVDDKGATHDTVSPKMRALSPRVVIIVFSVDAYARSTSAALELVSWRPMLPDQILKWEDGLGIGLAVVTPSYGPPTPPAANLPAAPQ